MLKIDNYTLTDKIYESIDTVLYRGYRDSDRAPITAKLLRNEQPSPRELARLLHEFSILKEIDTPGVAKAYALERAGNGLVLTMESLNGFAVSELLYTQRFDLRTTLRIGCALSSILEAIHRQHIIHKDIKPHNFLYDLTTSKVYLIDFGIATRLSHEVQKLANPNSLEGSLAYMSPEQTGRMNRPIDHRTDLYSLGITLYEMLTGELPFTSSDPMVLVHSHIARKPVPPHQRSPHVPRAVSDIVMKLCAKAAEERYQTAQGLRADLEECLSQLERTGEIVEFPPGRRDQSGALLIPQKLYGRSEETRALLGAFTRCSDGAAELLLVSGYSGVGKSALVHEVHKEIARRGGYFVNGKFEQFNRNVPYASISDAFRELIRLLLSQSQESVAAWKSTVQTAVGSNGRLLTDLIPELQILIGPQPELPPLGPNESQNRFNLVFQNFVRPFATAEHPLVLFLDDLQWADVASLGLIQELLTDPQRGHLLLIGAYRDNEISVEHVLHAALDQISKTSAVINNIKLQPLLQEHVIELVADALQSEPAQIEPLTELLYEKTHGNPFFLNQFLTALYGDGLLSFSSADNKWVWNSDGIRQRMATANVISFVAEKIQRLAPHTQNLVKLAACIGHTFDLQTLADLCGRSQSETAAELWEALLEGLILPVSSEYRFAHVPPNAMLEDAGDALFHVPYQFMHDRVHQAAYSLLDDEHKRQIHLQTGRFLLKQSADKPALREEKLFEITGHLNAGASLITDKEERWELAKSNALAGKKARAASAYSAAAEYYRMGLKMLQPSDWERQRDICFGLHTGLAESLTLVGQLEDAEALTELIASRAESLEERVAWYKLRVNLLNMHNDTAGAVRVGLEALSKLFNIDFPDKPEVLGALMMQELQSVTENLGARRIADLVNAPVLDSKDQVMIHELIALVAAPAYLVSPTLFGVTVLKRVNIALKFGHTPESSFAYSNYAFMLATAFGRAEEGYNFGKLALALNEKFGNTALSCKLYSGIGGYADLHRPIREVLPYFDRAYRDGLESGDFLFLSYSRYLAIIARTNAGDDLDQIREDIEKGLILMQRTKEPISTAALLISRQLVAALQGRTHALGSLDDESFKESTFLESLQRDNVMLPSYWYFSGKVQLQYLAGEYEAALSTAQAAIAAGIKTLGFYYTQELSFYICLSISGLREAGAETPTKYAELFAEHRELVSGMAKRCPANNEHKELLVAAEISRCENKATEAAELYDRAIAATQANQFIHHEGIANQLAAQFYLSRNRRKLASVYLGDAYYCYSRWGAASKASALIAKYPELLKLNTAKRDSAKSRPSDSATTSSRMVTGATLDAATVMLAAQAISSEIVLDKVLAQLMSIMVTNAGAQRGVLVLQRDGQMVVDATVLIDPDQTRLGLGIPLESYAELSVGIVQYVARTGEPVVLEDASQDPHYTNDAYIKNSRPRSLLCLALSHQGRLTGVMYFENNVAPGVFTQDRIEVLRLLSTQAASAVENALLYAHVQSVTERLSQTNSDLSRANSRMQTLTSELRKSNQELTAANEQMRLLMDSQRLSNDELTAAHNRLQEELSQRTAAEQARAALQEEIIRMQSARLAEMSTPLIPITESIMVMPLIGTMDNQRAEHVLETALTGVQNNRAQVVIIDITGMKHVDTSVAGTLIQTAGALRLLGAQSILTGIRADIAQTLVSLGIDLSSIVTRGTLQSGIAYALSQTGENGLMKSMQGRKLR